MHRKPAILLGSSHGASRFQCSPSCSSNNRTRSSTHPSAKRQQYATISSPQHNDIPWPELRDPRQIPTPYQIFNQRRGEEYSKHRFYELVKIYHPDRNNSPDGLNPCGCSHEQMLERYRLVVAANAILSDPGKREAYDRFGLGWVAWRDDDDSSSGSGSFKYTTFHRWRTATARKYKFSATHDDPMFNATWEDWERWYERQGYGGRYTQSPWPTSFFSGSRDQRTVYANNSVFISLVALLAALGGIGQATRANSVAQSRQERMQAVNEENSRHLMGARESARSPTDPTETKRQRIERFVRDRDGYGEDEFDGRTMRPGDEGVCASGAVKDRDLPPFWKRPPENV